MRQKTNSEQEKEKSSDTRPIPVPSLYYDNKLYETVFKNGRPMLAALSYNPRAATDEFNDYLRERGYADPAPESEVNYVFTVYDYVPQYEEENVRGIVMLPTDVTPFKNLQEVIDDIKKFIYKYCDLPDTFIQTSAYYVLMTYFYDRFDTIPYLSFRGDFGTGKSRCKLAIGSLCYLPTLASSGTSPAAFYRLIDKWHGTLLIDEADFISNQEKGQEILTLLNCGYDKFNPRVLCNTDTFSPNKNKLEFHNPFCPKIIARRNEFQDLAVESRCITQIMQQTERADVPNCLPPCFFEEAVQIRNKLVYARLKYWHLYANPATNVFEGLNVEPRLKQSYTGLGAVLIPFPEQFNDLKNFLIAKNEEIISDRQNTLEGNIVGAYLELVESGVKEITAQGILNGIGDTKMNAKTIGRRLKSLGFESYRDSSGKKRVISIKPNLLALLQKRYGFSDNTDKTDNSIVHAQSCQKNILRQADGLMVVLSETSETSETSEVCQTSETSVMTAHAETSAQNNKSIVPNTRECVLAQISKTPTPYTHLRTLFCDYSSIPEPDLMKHLESLKKNGDIMEVRPDEYVKL